MANRCAMYIQRGTSPDGRGRWCSEHLRMMRPRYSLQGHPGPPQPPLVPSGRHFSSRGPIRRSNKRASRRRHWYSDHPDPLRLTPPLPRQVLGSATGIELGISYAFREPLPRHRLGYVSIQEDTTREPGSSAWAKPSSRFSGSHWSSRESRDIAKWKTHPTD